MKTTFSDSLRTASVRLKMPAMDALRVAVQAARDDWSPEARAAAAEARKKHGHKTNEQLREEEGRAHAAGRHEEKASLRAEMERRADPRLQATFSRTPAHSKPKKVNRVTSALLRGRN